MKANNHNNIPTKPTIHEKTNYSTKNKVFNRKMEDD
jgi:hypothetical protein